MLTFLFNLIHYRLIYTELTLSRKLKVKTSPNISPCNSISRKHAQNLSPPLESRCIHRCWNRKSEGYQETLLLYVYLKLEMCFLNVLFYTPSMLLIACKECNIFPDFCSVALSTYTCHLCTITKSPENSLT